MTTPASLLPVALEAVDTASEMVRTRLPGLVTAKGDRDMVSEVDHAVEDTVRAFLGERTPGVGFLGEEHGSTGDNNLMWVLDPVDGTANFVHGLPLCAISLGLLHRGRPILGVIDLPFLGSRYSAAEHYGAHDGARRLQASETSNLCEAIVALGDYAVGPDAPDKNRIRFAITTALAEQAQRVRMLGSAAIDLVWVADGTLDAAVMLSNKPWDTAAGVIIAREAGVNVTDASGTDHTFDSAATIATAPALTGQVLALLRDATAATERTRRPSTNPEPSAAR